MPLIKCPDCSRDISDLAEICLQCGRPIRNAVVTKKQKSSDNELDMFSESEAIVLRKKIMENESHGTPHPVVDNDQRIQNARRDEFVANFKLAVLGIMTLCVAIIIKRLL